jgi:hypothetical protein
VWGPIAAVDRTVREVQLCFARRLLSLPVDRPEQVGSVRIALRITAADVSRLVLTVVSPSGSEVYLRTGGDEGGTIDAVFGADEESLEPLDWLAGEPALGTWTVTLYDPRCPYPLTVEEVALVFSDPRGVADYVRIEGWAASREAGRPSLRVAGGGLDQSSLTLEVVRWSVGPNGVPEGGAGDDERVGSLEATWSTTLDPAAATLGEHTGLLTSGELTGSGLIYWESAGARGALPVAIYPPDWVR